MPLKPKPQLSNYHLNIFIIIFALIGGVVLLITHAASNPNLPGDLNNDNTVNAQDLSLLLSNYGTTNSAGDVNSDGLVNAIDLSILLSHYGQSITAVKPTIPSGLTATPSAGSVNLTWNANPVSDNTDSYQVYWTTDPTWATFSQNLNVSGTSFNVSSLTSGTVYNFRISAHNSAGYSDWTNSVSATPAGTPNHGGIGYFYLGNGTLPPNPTDYDYIVTSVGGAAAAGAVQGPKTLVYMAGTDISTSFFTGVSSSTAIANNWVLKDCSGNLLVNQNFTDSYLGDVGNTAYQQAWTANVASFLAQNKLKGVYIDDVVGDITALTVNSVAPCNYQTQTAWENAMVSFMNYVTTTLHQSGYYVAANAGTFTSGNAGSDDGSLTAELWSRIGKPGVGLFNEYWEQRVDTHAPRSSGTIWYQHWDEWFNNLFGAVNKTGADFLGISYGPSAGTDPSMARYMKASFLMGWNGQGGCVFYDDGTTNPANPEWTYNIGSPSGAKYQVGIGWRRDFSGGTAIINPSASTSQTFSLGGTYYQANGTSVTSVTLAPTTALVLHK